MNEPVNNWEKLKAFLYSRMLIINVGKTIDYKDTTGLLLLWYLIQQRIVQWKLC